MGYIPKWVRYLFQNLLFSLFGMAFQVFKFLFKFLKLCFYLLANRQKKKMMLNNVATWKHLWKWPKTT